MLCCCRLVGKFPGGNRMPLHGKNILLRGCQLRNTEWCRGVVVYTGRETKIQMNAAEPAAKSSSLKPYVDRETLRVLCVQVGGVSWCHVIGWGYCLRLSGCTLELLRIFGNTRMLAAISPIMRVPLEAAAPILSQARMGVPFP